MPPVWNLLPRQDDESAADDVPAETKTDSKPTEPEPTPSDVPTPPQETAVDDVTGTPEGPSSPDTTTADTKPEPTQPATKPEEPVETTTEDPAPVPTQVPETPAPEPEIPAPEPETPAPETPAPETPEPETPAPETPEPETPAPEPETPAPEEPKPDTPAPEQPEPETPAPETPEPETPAPEEPEEPATEQPAEEPTTVVPPPAEQPSNPPPTQQPTDPATQPTDPVTQPPTPTTSIPPVPTSSPPVVPNPPTAGGGGQQPGPGPIDPPVDDPVTTSTDSNAPTSSASDPVVVPSPPVLPTDPDIDVTVPTTTTDLPGPTVIPIVLGVSQDSNANIPAGSSLSIGAPSESVFTTTVATTTEFDVSVTGADGSVGITRTTISTDSTITTSVTVTPSAIVPIAETSNKSNVGVIAGAVLGALVIIALGLVAIFFMQRRRRQLARAEEMSFPAFTHRDMEGAQPVTIRRKPVPPTSPATGNTSSHNTIRNSGGLPTSSDPFSDARAVGTSALPPIQTSVVDYLAGAIPAPSTRSHVSPSQASPPVSGVSASVNPFADPVVAPVLVRKDDQFRWSELSPDRKNFAIVANEKRMTAASEDSLVLEYPQLTLTNPDPMSSSAASASEFSFSSQQQRPAAPRSSLKNSVVADEEDDDLPTPRPFSSATALTDASKLSHMSLSDDPFEFDRQATSNSDKHGSTVSDADPFVYDRDAARARLASTRFEPPTPESPVARQGIPRISIMSATSVASGDLGYAV